jgi:hypothetical protein
MPIMFKEVFAEISGAFLNDRRRIQKEMVALPRQGNVRLPRTF